MNKILSVCVIALSLLSHSMAFSAPRTAADLTEKVTRLSKAAFGADVKQVVTRVTHEICGGEGPSYLVKIQVKHYDKQLNPKTGSVDLVARFETVKTYGITEQEVLEKDSPSLMDSEACLE